MTRDGLTTKRAAYETARLKLAHVQLESGQALAAAFKLVTQTSADALEIDRVGIWYLANRDRELVCKEQFIRASRQHTSGTVLRSREFPTYMQALTERRAIVADQAKTHATTRELAEPYLVPHGIDSLLDAPIIRGERVVGIVCHERLGPHPPWSGREIDFAGSVADLVALMLEQAERVELQAALKIQAEQTLGQQKLDALALLARSVGHDLNNVLAVFMASAEEVREGGLREAAESMLAAVEAGKNLSNQLFEIGGRHGAEPGASHVGKLLNRLLGPLRALAGSRVRLSLDVRDSDPRAQIEEVGLERLAFNLVANARDAILESGHVMIVVRSAEPEDDVAPDFLVIEVSDDGCGMDRRTRVHLFEPYFTTKPEGQGLGLATVYGIVTRAGGSIDVASEPGRGSSFRIALPRASSSQKP